MSRFGDFEHHLQISVGDYNTQYIGDHNAIIIQERGILMNQQGLGLMSRFGDWFHITLKYLLEMKYHQ